MPGAACVTKHAKSLSDRDTQPRFYWRIPSIDNVISTVLDAGPRS